MQIDKNPELLKPTKRVNLLFVLMAITNVVINIDHGTIPAATNQIEASLKIDNGGLGVLGSLVYAGIVTVGLFAGSIFLHIRARTLILISYVGMICTLSLFTINYPQNWPYFICRYLTGASQAPMLIYFPVWVDNFGQNQKTIWLTILQGGVPVGIFSGYVLSSIITYFTTWEVVFYIQVILLGISFVCFLFISTSDFEITERLAQIKQKLSSMDVSQLNTSSMQKERIVIAPSYFQLLGGLFKTGIWICVAIAISVIYFVVTGIQFWISNYMEVVLDADPKLVKIFFSLISITAPILGCVYGGVVTQKTGGYESNFSLRFCLFNSVLACLSAIPIPFLDSFWLVCLLIWLLLFFGGAMVPPLTGIMLTSVPPKLRPFANANTIMVYNLFGFLPAPMVYGYLTANPNKPRQGIRFLMFYPLLGFVTILLAAIEKKRLIRKNNQKRENLFDNLVAKTKLKREDDQSQTIDVHKSAPDLNETRVKKARSLNYLLKSENKQLTEKVLAYNYIPMNQSIATSIQKDDIMTLFGHHDHLEINEESLEEYEDTEYPTDL